MMKMSEWGSYAINKWPPSTGYTLPFIKNLAEDLVLELLTFGLLSIKFFWFIIIINLFIVGILK